MCEAGDTAIERLGDSWSSLSTGSANAFGGGRPNLTFSKFGGQNLMMLPENFEPGEYDVICGRGKKSFHHLGNSYLRDVVAGCLDQYASASKVEKSVILCDVVDQIRRSSPNGGFVKKDATSGRWHPVDDFLAREKTSQAFRDALTDLYKSSNSSKKKRRHAERKREHSSSTEDLLASDQGSLGYTASTCSTTTNGSSFVPQVPTLATVFTPSAAVMGVSALMGGGGVGAHGLRQVEIPSPSEGSSSRSLQLQQKREDSNKSLQLQSQEEPMQKQSSRSVADPLRRSCPNMKFNCGIGGHELTQGALPLPSLSMQQQLLSKSLQLQMLQEPQELQQHSAQAVVDPLRRSCPNIKIGCDGVVGKSSLRLGSHDKESKPMQQPSSNIKFDCDAANGNGRNQLKCRAEDVAQGVLPLVPGPQPLQQLSTPSVADPLRRSCPNIKFFSDVRSFQLQNLAQKIDISQGVLSDLQKPQQLEEPFVRPGKLRRSCPNLNSDIRSFQLESHEEEIDMSQGVLPDLQKPRQLEKPFMRPDKLRRSCPSLISDIRSFQLESHAEEEEIDMSQDALPSSLNLPSFDDLRARLWLNDQDPRKKQRTSDLQKSEQLEEPFVRPDKLRRSCPNIKFNSLKSFSLANEAEDLNTLSAHSQPNFDTKTSEQQQHHGNIDMDNDNFHSFLKSMEVENDKFEMDQGGDMLFDRLVHFAEHRGAAFGNPFEPEPIPEKVTTG